MDNLTRWAIGLGAGVAVGMTALGAHHFATFDAKNETFSYALQQVTPENKELDVIVEFDSYDIEPFVEIAQLLQDANVERSIGCGSGVVSNPAHVCTADATIPDGLHLTQAKADVVRDDYALTIGEYRSEYEDILTRAGTILVDTGTGLRPVTYEGGGTFTLGFLGQSPKAGKSESWQFAVAAVPYTPVWLAAGALGAVVTVLVAGCFRPREEPAPVEVGVEFFDDLLEDERG